MFGCVFAVIPVCVCVLVLVFILMCCSLLRISDCVCLLFSPKCTQPSSITEYSWRGSEVMYNVWRYRL